MEENKKLLAIMEVFNKYTYEGKREKVISLVSSLWESDVYATTLDILKSFDPSEEYMENIYKIIMEAKLKAYEEGKEQEKIDAAEKMKEYMNKLNELSMKQKEQDEKEAEEILNLI